MHCCLRIPEIADMICYELSPTSSFPNKKRDLVALSQVSKTFNSVALKYVWERIHTLKAFLSCFPEDVVNPYLGKMKAGCVFSLPVLSSLTAANATMWFKQASARIRTLVPEDFARLNSLYAHRVRHNDLDYLIQSDAEVAHCLYLSSMFSLPNLVEVTC